MVTHQPDELPRTQQQYTIPGILHYIQHEWARFEMERAHWEVERAELQVSMATAASLAAPNGLLGTCLPPLSDTDACVPAIVRVAVTDIRLLCEYLAPVAAEPGVCGRAAAALTGQPSGTG